MSEAYKKLTAWRVGNVDVPLNDTYCAGSSEFGADVCRLLDEVTELKVALKPFAEAARNFQYAIGPDGLDSGLAISAEINVRPEYYVTFSTEDFSTAVQIYKKYNE